MKRLGDPSCHRRKERLLVNHGSNRIAELVEDLLGVVCLSKEPAIQRHPQTLAYAPDQERCRDCTHGKKSDLNRAICPGTEYRDRKPPHDEAGDAAEDNPEASLGKRISNTLPDRHAHVHCALHDYDVRQRERKNVEKDNDGDDQKLRKSAEVAAEDKSTPEKNQ